MASVWKGGTLRRRREREGQYRAHRRNSMSQLRHHAVLSICGRICNIPLLQLLVGYMDANKCIEELLKQLEEERRNVRREKLAVARLQREVARSKSEGTMRQKLIHVLEEERRLRLDSEKRLREVTDESELGRAQMVSLQQHFSRMEETVRTLLQNQGVLEQTAVDTVDIMKAYKDKLSEEVQRTRDSLEQNSPLPSYGDPLLADIGSISPAEEFQDQTKLLLERLRALEQENSALAMENESQREQYEHCLDEVANQVVQALLTQKDLREECLKLRTRVFDLEQQNRTMSVLFQQRVRPASDLLLQKLHSRIMDLSASDLLLEPERSKSFLLSRNTASPPHDVQLNGKAGLPVAKCLSQLSLTVQAPVYPRSSCSSSELSLSSACSEYSSGSYTWNDGRSCGKMSSLTWEKRLSLGSSAPGNICTPLEEQLPTRRKESHILEGLRKLQRRKPKGSSSSWVSKSGDKDCMNSNEGIYSLGIKSGSKGISNATYVGRTTVSGVGGKRFVYDSDDADDESLHSAYCRRDSVPSKEGGWMYFRKLSHSVSDSVCSWDKLKNSGIVVDSNCSMGTKHPPGYNSKERPEKLKSFINSFLSGGRTSAVLNPSLLHFDISPTEAECPLHLSDTDPEDLHSEVSDHRLPVSRTAEQLQKDIKRLSRDADKLLPVQWLRREPGRTQSADGRPRPFSPIKQHKGAKTQSEESIMAIFDADGQPIELSAQQSSVGAGARKEIPGRKENGVAEYAALSPHDRPIRHKVGNNGSNSREGSPERLQTHVTPLRKLIKPPSKRSNKGHSVPPMNNASTSPKAISSKIPSSRGKGSPLKVSKGSTTETSNSGPTSGFTAQESKSPSSPPVKMSRFIKAPGCTTSPKAVNNKLPGRNDWTKGSSSSVPTGSPHLPRRHLDHVDYREQPTRDKHCEASSKTELRSPSPPPPPGRTTSLLIRPNYDGSPQALKPGAQPSMPTTVRGPPPRYHPPPVPNMQHSLPPPPYKGQDTIDLDAGYGTAIAPQKLLDKSSQQHPASNKTPSKGTSKWVPTKLYLPSSASGHVPDHPENAPKSSKNVPPPSYNSQRGSSLQSTFTSQKGTNDNRHPMLYKTSSSFPVTLQGHPQCSTEPHSSMTQPPQAVANPSVSGTSTQNFTEKASKTRIPMGFKAFVKSPPSLQKGSTTIPGKQEKEHINLVSKETVTSNGFACEGFQAVYVDSLAMTSIMETKGEVQCIIQEEEAHTTELAEQEVGDKSECDRRLFKRSISVTTKPHLKPVLGMNGAKARSQSFSTHYMEKPNISVLDGHVKIRTQIITNSGERGNSLTRQSSLVEGLQIKPSSGSGESQVRCYSHRLSHYGGMTGSNSHQGLPERASKSGSTGEGPWSTSKGESVSAPNQKEVRSLPLADRIGLKNTRNPKKVASHPQFESPASPVYSPEATAKAGKVLSLGKLDLAKSVKVQVGCSQGAIDKGEQPMSPTVCTIEEKVMMGIEENIQKGQGQEKVIASETKQKTGPSLANWFGLRKSKLPALNGKKSDATSPKEKDEKKELKIGSVLGGKQMKSDKKKDKKKNDSQFEKSPELTLSENKLSSIMDHCNIHMGQIANQIQCSTTYIGKDQFMKELLGRSVRKGDSIAESLPGISIPKRNSDMRGDLEICSDTATIIVTQKISLQGENEEDPTPETSCQDHMIGSSCQMRTLDSGIGTFPLPDSVTRVNGCHIPRSESSPDRMMASIHSPTDPDQDLLSASAAHSPSHVKVPSLSETHPHAPPTSALGHSLSDPSVTGRGCGQEALSRLPRPSTSDVIRRKRLSQIDFCSTSHTVTTEAHEEQVEKKRITKDLNSSSDRAASVCTYSGSSSDTETESEGNTLGSTQSTLTNRAKTSNQVDYEEKTMKRSSVGKFPSIMDYYQHDMFSHVEKDDHRRSFSQYNLLHNQSLLEGKAGDRLSITLHSTRKLRGRLTTCYASAARSQERESSGHDDRQLRRRGPGRLQRRVLGVPEQVEQQWARAVPGDRAKAQQR
ncbi:nck-associated protein 5-like isoform X3 [Salvelinus fontinalis]|uniref:nck-associated protein 5-like isoform X3 n=1 Tax=Salvelinus fontinalis TaxID=8038 RepID=UPI002486B54B|nr:nck-associated protein 5-like isoform X3 [Salvelinus fontinalis]